MASEAKRAIPVLVLKEGTRRTYGTEALRNNILAATTLSRMMKTSLGPRGLDKMLIDQFGDVVISNDGAAILDEIDIVHPGAKFLAKLSKTQDIEVGDGTTTVVVLAGELLGRAEELLDNDIHPTKIIDGYQFALKKSLEILNDLAIKIDPEKREDVLKVAKTCIASKAIAPYADHFSNIAYDAIRTIMYEENGKRIIPLDEIKIEKKEGGNLLDTELIYGIVLDKEIVHHRMPRRIENAKILLVAYSLELEKSEFADVHIFAGKTSIDTLLRWEKEKLREMAEKIINTGANVVICQKGIDDVVQHYLAKQGIIAVRRVKKSDIEKLAKATGAKIIQNEEFLSPNALGFANVVEEKKVGDETMLFIRGCKNPRAVSILIRGGSKLTIEEAERNLKDVLNGVRNVMLDPRIIPAGGAPEMAIATKLRKIAEKELTGRQSLVVKAFADAIESIPSILIETAGLDPIEDLNKLRTFHAQGKYTYGVDVIEGRLADMIQLGYVDPYVVKKNAIESAVEAAIMLLRIDDIIAAKEAFELKKEETEVGEKEPEEEI
ncbi:MAG: thermosome subunit [Crenarchaeota archaeon]|nr:thermosome subunit [Thermoproteota archaeon]MCR8453830.1 thermosome subunit [Thermoproteota archaeon]MCR8455351.1 thermosome subunit [Thermoproteota archaeon]MCR8462621.1 thermosome subunit [Thermoproteota archaeon]MCR8470930.1 thermosome subunit [Thermoproteota archaeon]